MKFITNYEDGVFAAIDSFDSDTLVKIYEKMKQIESSCTQSIDSEKELMVANYAILKSGTILKDYPEISKLDEHLEFGDCTESLESVALYLLSVAPYEKSLQELEDITELYANCKTNLESIVYPRSISDVLSETVSVLYDKGLSIKSCGESPSAINQLPRPTQALLRFTKNSEVFEQNEKKSLSERFSRVEEVFDTLLDELNSDSKLAEQLTTHQGLRDVFRVKCSSQQIELLCDEAINFATSEKEFWKQVYSTVLSEQYSERYEVKFTVQSKEYDQPPIAVCLFDKEVKESLIIDSTEGNSLVEEIMKNLENRPDKVTSKQKRKIFNKNIR